jgi:hypothetical protein
MMPVKGMKFWPTSASMVDGELGIYCKRDEPRPGEKYEQKRIKDGKHAR